MCAVVSQSLYPRFCEKWSTDVINNYIFGVDYILGVKYMLSVKYNDIYLVLNIINSIVLFDHLSLMWYRKIEAVFPVNIQFIT